MPLCSLLQKNYQDLLDLKERFGVELKQAIESGDFTTLALLKAEITEKKQALEGEINPFESALKIREQYETQKEIYAKIGLLEKREGILGMEGIDGKWYPFPSIAEIHKRFQENKEVLDIKTDQGFEKLLIVPFGMSLAKFTETMEKTLRAHYVEMEDPGNKGEMIPDPERTRLFGTKKKASDPDESLKMDTTKPLWVADSYVNADTTGTLVYFPVMFRSEIKRHKGKTKKELLQDTKQGFQFLLIEANPNIPVEGTNEIIGTKQPRKRLETNDSPETYLETLQTKPEYAHEQGLTPEAWITQFLLHLEETNQVIDDWNEHDRSGQINANLSGWFPDSGKVANGRWSRDSAQANLNKYGIRVESLRIGSRSAVMI